MNAVGSDIRYRAAVATAVVAGAFSAIVCALLVWNYLNSDVTDPLDSQELTTLKVEQKANPSDERLMERIRRMDLELRREYFRRQAFGVRGGYLLVGGLAALLIATGVAVGCRKSVPMVATATDQERAEVRSSVLARWFVAAAGLVLLAGASIMAVIIPTEGFPAGDSIEKPALQVARFPSDEETAKNWSRFRGPGGAGISAYTNVPTEWNGKTGEGILWKTPVPLPGKNSPVVWFDRIFLTGATAQARQVYCFDADSGKLLWQQDVADVPGSVTEPPKVLEENSGYAAPTAVADGQRVYAIFANGDLVCFDFDGKKRWAMNLGLPDNTYGYATSLTMWRNLLLVQFDQRAVEQNKSKIIALDGPTGRRVWLTHRPVPDSWSSPIVINAAGRDQIITCGNPWVISYNPADGAELWRAKCLGGDVAPSPICAGGLVFAVNSGASLSAIKPDGAGDVTKTHVAWTATDGLPDICSPVSDGKLLWLMETYGTLTCYDVQTGKIVWDKDMDASFNASPAMVGRLVYLINADGVTIVIEASGKYKEITRSELGEKVYASPAFMDGRIYIRGEKNLFCIGR